MANETLKDLSARQLLSKYKRTLRNSPNVMFASNEELDQYYDQVLELEDEIIKRMKSENAS